MNDIIRYKGHAYILATSPRLASNRLTLKEGDSFAVLDRYGDTGTVGGSEQGIYHAGTRMLSHHELRLGRQRPLLLSSTVQERNAFVAVDLTNPDIQLEDDRILQRGSIHIFRSMFLYQGAFYCRTRIQNYGEQALDTEISFLFDADFADVFEVRGMLRKARGHRHVQLGERTVSLLYDGLDGITRRAHIEFSEQPADLSAASARFVLRLPSKRPFELMHTIGFDMGAAEPPSAGCFETRQRALVDQLQSTEAARIGTSNEQFSHWLARSSADLAMLVSHLPEGPYPYAGVPWFSTIVGRDGLITALQVLWLNPGLARGVLATLAACQAENEEPAHDAEPGKILHEARQGEMANLGEVPYSRYYGSADSTPLFIVLAAAYAERTGDDEFLRGLWPNIELALEWIDRYGDIDGDGFVEYARKRPDGLRNQGWKDSDDSISHADGSLAEGPIALCEIQGYVYAAKRGAARLARQLGHEEHGRRLEEQADTLRRRVEEAFWLEDIQTYALALDGEKRPCRVRSSNPGHVLFSRLASPERAHHIALFLTSEEMFSGWGVRTLGQAEKRYNPMSYHNGSVWPHDNAMIAAGLSHYGEMDGVERILTAMFDAASAVDLQRLPELFCGFARQSGQGPPLYPVACIPQAWASGTVFMLLQATLGLTIQARPPTVVFDRPRLPLALPQVELWGLAVDDATVDLRLSRHPSGSVTIDVLARRGTVAVSVLM